MNATDLIARFEGFRPSPYLCPAGVATIGYGTTRYPGGAAVTLRDKPCTEAQAREWLQVAVADVEAALRTYVRVPLTDGQRAALVSLVYNIGAAAFGRSTLLRLLNRGDTAGAAAQFGEWVRGGGAVLPGLVKRRAAERAVFESAT